MKTLITDLVTLSKAKGLSPRLDDRPVREILHFVQDDKATEDGTLGARTVRVLQA